MLYLSPIIQKHTTMKIEINVSEPKENIPPSQLQMIRRCSNVLEAYGYDVKVNYESPAKVPKTYPNAFLLGKVDSCTNQ